MEPTFIPPKINSTVLTPEELAPLLSDLRAGRPVQKLLRDGLVGLLDNLPAKSWAMGYEMLSDLIDELATNDVRADDLQRHAWSVIRYAPKAQKEEDLSVVKIPKSTRSTRKNQGKHTPSVQQFDDVVDDDGEAEGGELYVVDDPSCPVGTSSPEVERDELISFARTDFEKIVAWRIKVGQCNEQIAHDLSTTVSRIRRTETILRNRAGYPKPRKSA